MICAVIVLQNKISVEALHSMLHGMLPIPMLNVAKMLHNQGTAMPAVIIMCILWSMTPLKIVWNS